jgi:hypothetical protein
MYNDTAEEAFFRERYAQELRKKKQQVQQDQGTYYRGNDELVNERRELNQQQMKTPGRRGEEIKQEEIDKELVRRSIIKK